MADIYSGDWRSGIEGYRQCNNACTGTKRNSQSLAPRRSPGFCAGHDVSIDDHNNEVRLRSDGGQTRRHRQTHERLLWRRCRLQAFDRTSHTSSKYGDFPGCYYWQTLAAATAEIGLIGCMHSASASLACLPEDGFPAPLGTLLFQNDRRIGR